MAAIVGEEEAADAEAERWVFANYVGPLGMYLRAGFETAGRTGGQLLVTKRLDAEG